MRSDGWTGCWRERKGCDYEQVRETCSFIKWPTQSAPEQSFSSRRAGLPDISAGANQSDTIVPTCGSAVLVPSVQEVPKQITNADRIDDPTGLRNVET